MGITTIILGLAMFLFLITIHEAGHFFVAKLSGIKVNEFSIGMGPSIYKKQKEETLYSIRALPIGGYVSMEGEESDSNDERSFNNSPAWKRFLTILAGPGINLLFGVIVFFILSSINGVPTTTIESVNESSPAYEAGLQAGDRILKINNKSVNTFAAVNIQINTAKDNLNIEVKRGNDIKTVNVSPQIVENQKIIGITPKIENNFLNNISYAFNMTLFIVLMIFENLAGLFTGAIGLDKLSGPVGVIQQVGKSAQLGLTSLMSFAAMISINLGVFNLLPIPALDGSKLVFIAIEKILGKPLNKKFEERVTIVGFFLLLGLIIYVTVKEVIALF